ncbi:hypothetical protein GALMADRAFT_538229 [Galerina marginata CBS 339.88]|uniref:Uncharacterized protein n=1 Tax=Galerina marginata (strain CBS 339.88) TaxID=685588 RepID=A0A067T5L3_GALM3|nr:hypothetical protein GALMADRAFT_538229 [Galerina marginata CBS 339.88]
MFQYCESGLVPSTDFTSGICLRGCWKISFAISLCLPKTGPLFLLFLYHRKKKGVAFRKISSARHAKLYIPSTITNLTCRVDALVICFTRTLVSSGTLDILSGAVFLSGPPSHYYYGCATSVSHLHLVCVFSELERSKCPNRFNKSANPGSRPSIIPALPTGTPQRMENSQ